MKNLKALGALAATCALVGALNAGNFSEKDAKVSFDQAIGIAQQNFGDATIKSVEIDDEHGRLVYEIESHKEGSENEIKIDAQSGEILKTQTQKKLKPSKIDYSQVKISAADARAKALSVNAGWDFREVDLKSNGGKPAYEVKLRQGMSKKEVLIDAATGEQILQRQK
ncbi:PepSY domain-containing protein [uncultured Campylobacter sp.]|uniref:PepSY domain-containing protein n=1 Tax=uncultured Campylobacter sp. TaxID=218934 RepID=UPI0026083407|nr:PepSY domain-containing protein [uncultured Campylobacter sp.]